MKEYIHSYQKNLDVVKRHISQSEEISEKNKKVITDFDQAITYKTSSSGKVRADCRCKEIK